MSSLQHTSGPSWNGTDVYTQIVNGIRDRGFIVIDDVFSVTDLHTWLAQLHDLDDEFKQAGVGRQDDYQQNQFIRADQICWIDLTSSTLANYREFIERLRLLINRELFLGLFDYECHYAIYPEGGFYRKHLDAFKGQSNRRLSTVLYLNPDWQPADGGELQVYRDDELVPFLTVSPVFGRLVIFLSEDFPHEVRPALKRRFSLTGWYRVNATDASTVDAPITPFD